MSTRPRGYQQIVYWVDVLSAMAVVRLALLGAGGRNADAPVVRSAPLNADTLKTSEDSTSDALFTQELMASMQPITSWARALSARDLLTDFSGGRTLDECGVAQSSSSELATQRLPSQP